MISDRALAKQVQETVLSVNTLLNYSVNRLQEGQVDKDELKRYLKFVGRIMGITTTDILPELWRMHPDIVPDEFKKP